MKCQCFVQCSSILLQMHWILFIHFKDCMTKQWDRKRIQYLCQCVDLPAICSLLLSPLCNSACVHCTCTHPMTSSNSHMWSLIAHCRLLLRFCQLINVILVFITQHKARHNWFLASRIFSRHYFQDRWVECIKQRWNFNFL